MRRLFGLCLMLLVSNASAAPASISIDCPAHFPADQVTFPGKPFGWIPFMPADLEAHTADLMYGPPARQALAKPASYRVHAHSTVATWELAGLPQAQKWLQCGYGAGDELTLSQQLPMAVDTCRVTRHLDAQRNVVKVEAVCTLCERHREAGSK